jgi:hypothetical protein
MKKEEEARQDIYFVISFLSAFFPCVMLYLKNDGNER